MDDYTPTIHRDSRSAKIACGVTVLALVGVLVAFYVSANSRYPVIGAGDPATGYRIRYTVSSRYRNIEVLDSHALRDRHELEERELIPNAMSAPVRWFYVYILRKPDAASMTDQMDDLNAGLKAHGIQQITFLGNAPEGRRISADGYVLPGDIAGVGSYVSQDQTTVAKCPATWYSFDRTDSSEGGRTLRYYNLYIHPRGKPITFMFSGISDAGGEPNDVYDELNAIRSSIHIDKIN